MDIERLSKSQIILLTLLVSFVTSIATGIVTVSLMDQAPPSIAQTVNRVVERTVEKIVPSGQAAGAAAASEKTIVVTESDLIVKAVESATPSIVRLFTTSLDAAGKESDVFLGLGIVVSEGGVIATDAASLPASGTLVVSTEDGQRLSGTLISSDAKSGLALLQGATSTAEGLVTWKSAILSESKQSLGETVFTISGRTATRIGDGIVTALGSSETGTAEDIVETNIPVGSVAFGSPLVNMNGQIVGISTTVSRALSENAFGAASIILDTLKQPSGEQNTPPQQ
ncbi:trypsin-like peptidase domain-containing protein [Candidatus Kaiserbacteria bacterium]|nr:trypsin-like peptidase domain-containing protein [Candidatus Kaiserbacteria bacterium]